MNDDVVIVPRLLQALFDTDVMRRTVQESRTRHQGGRLGQPCRIPKASDFSSRLVAGAGPAVKAIKTGRREEKRAHFEVTSLDIEPRLFGLGNFGEQLGFFTAVARAASSTGAAGLAIILINGFRAGETRFNSGLRFG